MKTVNLELTYSDARTLYEGGSELELVGRTPGNQSVRVKLKLAPTTVGYLAERLHKIVREQQKELDSVKQKLRGDL